MTSTEAAEHVTPTHTTDLADAWLAFHSGAYHRETGTSAAKMAPRVLPVVPWPRRRSRPSRRQSPPIGSPRPPVRQWPASVPRRDRTSWTRRHQPDTRYGADVDVLDPVERLFTFSGPFTHQRSAVRYRPRPPRLLQVSGERDTAMAADFVRRVALHRRWSETEADDAGTPVALAMTCCAVCGRCVRVA